MAQKRKREAFTSHMFLGFHDDHDPCMIIGFLLCCGKKQNTEKKNKKPAHSPSDGDDRRDTSVGTRLNSEV